MKTTTEVRVRFVQTGMHDWPQAHGERVYLASPHRHVFHIEVRLRVGHGDRQVEFHDLQQHGRAELNKLAHDILPDGRYDFRNMSCEHIALALLQRLKATYPQQWIAVGVSEDGECGALVTQEV